MFYYQTSNRQCKLKHEDKDIAVEGLSLVLLLLIEVSPKCGSLRQSARSIRILKLLPVLVGGALICYLGPLFVICCGGTRLYARFL